MFPLLTLIMEHIAKMGLPKHFFTNLFAVMYIGMAPLVSMAAIISEEKETNTLRPLLMANVKPWEYLFGIGCYIWIICMLGACVLVGGQYQGIVWVSYMAVMAVGILLSILIGAAIGAWSKNQMMATSLTVPIMMVFSFLPMLSMFNQTIKRFAKITYSQQISQLLLQIEDLKMDWKTVVIILGNIGVAMACFLYAYKKRGLKA